MSATPTDLLAPLPADPRTAPAAAGAPLSPTLADRPILIAIDGTRASDAALRVGDELARRDGVAAFVLTVHDPLPTLGDPAAALTTEASRMDGALGAELRRSVAAQLERNAFAVLTSRAEFERGHPARTIARVAGDREARLVVLGIGRHGPLDRAFNRETALQVIRHARVPVLAVPSDARALPRRAVVAVDFSASSRAAARAALTLLGARGALYLVHVAPQKGLPTSELDAFDTAWERDYREAAEEMLTSLESDLAAPADVHVERVLRSGEPARELLELAEAEAIDLIATGNRGHGPFVRTIVGSVSTRVLRGARCAVLVTPTAAASPRT